MVLGKKGFFQLFAVISKKKNGWRFNEIERFNQCYQTITKEMFRIRYQITAADKRKDELAGHIYRNIAKFTSQTQITGKSLLSFF